MPEQSGYIVVYVGQTQRGSPSPPFGDYYRRAVPVETITIHGVEYAWIYQVAPPVDGRVGARFGDALQLYGIRDQGAPQPGATWTLQLIWGLQAKAPLNLTMFAHLLAPDGTRVAQVDLPYPTASWASGSYQTTNLPIDIPAGAAPGEYRLVVGLYDPASGQRAMLSGAPALDPAVDGPETLLLRTVTLR
jgi:hypothetical protein